MKKMRAAGRCLLPAACLGCGVLLGGPAAAAGRQAQITPTPVVMSEGVERVTSVEGITEYRLGNGLRVLLFPDPSKQTVTVNVTYQVGSRHEGYGETGMAHLLEHMVFKGTPRHPNITKELTDHGARPNGTTWFDRTNYFETFAASDENLRWALDLEADRMVNSFIAKKDLDSEMTVVRNEFESGENSPRRVLMERVLSTAYLWHNYGKSTIGARSDIENVPIDRLQAFYRQFYQPDNAVLLVAGKFDEAATVQLVRQIFGPIPRPTRRLPAFYTAEPTQDGERTVTLRRVGDLQYAIVAYHVPAGADPDFAPLGLLTHVLGSAPSGRLYRALVDTKMASNVFGQHYQLHDPGVALFGAEVRRESSLDVARDILLQTVESLVTTPATAEEIERARASLLKQIDLDLSSSSRVGLQISEWIGMGDWRLLFLNRDRLRTATVADVQRVAARYYKASNRTVGLFVPTPSPDRAEIPTVPDVAAMVKDYKGDAIVAAGEAFDPSPASIETRTVRVALPGSLGLVLVPKKTRGRTVVANLTLRFGDERALKDRTAAAQLTGALLMRGTLRHTRQQIQDDLDRLKARASVGGGATSATASIETNRENLAAVLRLVGEILREPRFDRAEFDLVKQQRLAALEQQRSDPQALAATTFQRILRPYPRGDVRNVPTIEESIADLQAATIEDVRRFFGDFYGASRGELTVVGDHDPDEVTLVARDVFGAWPSPRPVERVTEDFIAVAPVNQTIETPDKANASFLAGLNVNVRDDDADYPALVIGNYILGGGFLNSRLATRIRQQEGISYGIGSQLQASALDRGGSFLARAIYAPENLGRLERAVNEEIARVIQDGFTDEEVSAAKAGWLQGRQVGRAQDGELAARLGALSYAGRTIAWDEAFERRIAALTPEAIHAAFARHIDPSRLVVVKAGDFARAGRTPAAADLAK